MYINGLKQDYSLLFESMNQTKNSGSSADMFSMINLADYYSIKSGSYGKLLKAYYSMDDTDSSSASTTNKVTSTSESSSVQELKKVQTEAEGLRDSASALSQKGSKSVFKEDDMSKVYTAVSDFVTDYNAVVDKGTASDSKAIVTGAEGLVTLAKDYEKELNEIGITINKNSQLSIDKDTFMNADMDKVKSLFNDKNSFAQLVSLRAVSMGNTAYSESNRSSLYTVDGTYMSLSTGDVLNSIV